MDLSLLNTVTFIYHSIRVAYLRCIVIRLRLSELDVTELCIFFSTSNPSLQIPRSQS